MENIIYEKSYPQAPYNVSEIYRYGGVGEITPELSALVSECIKLCDGAFFNKLCYGVYDITRKGDTIDFGFTKLTSRTLGTNLKDCNKVIVFTATVGIEIDRLVNRYGKISPSKAVILQAVGAERIETLCNTFNDEIKSEFKTVPRISPGYGDFPLEFQREIFNLIMPAKRIGLNLNESFLMSPTKSVTALIGLKASP